MPARRPSLFLALGVGVGLALATSAGAQVIIQTFTIPSGTSVPFSQNFTFNTFNPALGILGNVTLSLSTSITAEIDIFNANATPQPFTNATATIPVTLTGPGSATVLATAIAGPVSGTASPGLNAFPGLPASASTTVNVLPTNWGFYENPPSGITGTLNVSAAGGNYNGTPIPGVFFGGSATAGATVTLEYDYSTAIPEPGATAFLTAGALGGLGLALRRRKQSNV
ncbi:MAG: choice-of-anchor E domain-containing protein [Opitutales bacterium]|jgi:hypothetical protein